MKNKQRMYAVNIILMQERILFKVILSESYYLNLCGGY